MRVVPLKCNITHHLMRLSFESLGSLFVSRSLSITPAKIRCARGKR